MTNDTRKISVDDIEYNFTDLPKPILENIARYEIWAQQLNEHRLETEKCELAVNSIRTTIVEQVRQHNGELVKKMLKDNTIEGSE